ncbi:MAG: AMP-binding protein [Bacteroidales bacterium]|nr:AMP-binding protein [Bacteroidales bacterium]
MKSGNICVPLNPAIELENLDKVLAKTGSTLAFISKRYQQRFASCGFTVYDDDSLKYWNTAEANNSTVADKATFDENRLAEIIFTSGSTGSRRVMIT